MFAIPDDTLGACKKELTNLIKKSNRLDLCLN